MFRILLQLLQRLLLDAGILEERCIIVCRVFLFGKLGFGSRCGGVCLVGVSMTIFGPFGGHLGW